MGYGIGEAALVVSALAGTYGAIDAHQQGIKGRRQQRAGQQQAQALQVSAKRDEAAAFQEANQDMPDPTAILEAELRRQQKRQGEAQGNPIGSTTTLGGG